ncbi:MAG: molecular chaperone DnaJ, partial [Proteobacteria bacterium]|nr:molecular chaperone DnaJ [Pseudomonadota bacterium]
MASKRDYYEILEIDKNSSAEEIKRSYRKLAVKYHPDKNPGDASAEEKFKELGEAYDVLSEPEKKAAYDRFGHAAFAQGGGGGRGAGSHDPFDIFKDV